MKTTFIFTVDVESRNRGGPDADILGVLPQCDERFGIEKMMDMLEAHQARGTFFLNVYEIATHPEGSIARVANLIRSRGHDLELHTHPYPMYRFYALRKYPIEEQVAILEKGMSLIEKWTGKRVIAHRAGAFSGNLDTVRACEAVGLMADCSLSAGSRVAVPLVGELGATNLVRRVGKIWEIPVTYFVQLRLGPWRSRRILDIEGCSLAEIKSVTRWAIRQGLPTVCILMHSFSFSRHRRPARRVIRRFSALLAWLREQEGVELATVEQACRTLDMHPVPSIETTELHTGVWLTWGRALQSWNENWKNLLVSMAGLAAFGVMVAVLVYLGHALLRH